MWNRSQLGSFQQYKTAGDTYKLYLHAQQTAKMNRHFPVLISVGQDWRPFGNPKKIRPFDSVILAKNISDEIKKDVQDFLQLVDKWI